MKRAEREAEITKNEKTWRQELVEERDAHFNRRFAIDINSNELYLIVRPLERLLPHERTPNEKALLEFLEKLPSLEEGYVYRSPGTKKRPRKKDNKYRGKRKRIDPEERTNSNIPTHNKRSQSSSNGKSKKADKPKRSSRGGSWRGNQS